MVMGNAMWQLIKQMDMMSLLVLVTLLVLSIGCWSLFFYKVIMLRMKKRQLNDAISHMRGVHNLEQLLEAVPLFGGTIAGYFLSRNLSFLKGLLEARKEGELAGLSKQQWDVMDQHMAQTLDDMVQHEEEYVPFLSTSAAVSPLLGLFGTVWGLVHAFIRISEKQTADIATVAPGIAEALITTLGGLMIAIPALVMFSYVNTQIRTVEQKLVTLADRFGFIVQKQLLFTMDGSMRQSAHTDWRNPHATL